MSNISLIKKKADVFGQIFFAANLLQTISDRTFKSEGLTTKQWMLLAAVERAFDEPPGIKELASIMGSSHQNVKQIALKLRTAGYVDLVQDEKDKRVLRVHLTDKVKAVFSKRHDKDARFISEMFDAFTEDEIDLFFDYMNRVIDKVQKMEAYE